MLYMATIEEIEPILNACLRNAESLLASAKAVMAPGQYHVGYHLAALAMEEIGKAGLILTEALGPHPGEEDKESRRSKWMEDHERKLFWAIWLPSFGVETDWRIVPQHMEFAKQIHERRKRTLYFDPEHPDAQAEITEARAARLISLTESRLEMEKLKKYRDLDEDEKSDMQWFFLASQNPELKPYIFSKQSIEKQAEMREDRTGWIRWLRGLFEESTRKAMEIAQFEMQRQKPEEKEKFDDKWKLRIRLKSWSHSIRPNQLTGWNKGIDKIKLIHTTDRSELIVEFTIGKNILLGDLWNMGMQSVLIFVSALNISTGGFFWWYFPTFTSRYYESITDLETNHQVVIERVPELRISWGHMALKADDLLQQMPMVFGFVAKASEPEQAFYHRYFGMLGMMAKNDIFFQFEHDLVVGFTECFELALKSYNDWDGDAATYEAAVTAVFTPFTDSAEFMRMLKEVASAVNQIRTHAMTRPITLEDVARAKVIFDIYIRLKAAAYMQEQIAIGALKAEVEDNPPTGE